MAPRKRPAAALPPAQPLKRPSSVVLKRPAREAPKWELSVTGVSGNTYHVSCNPMDALSTLYCTLAERTGFSVDSISLCMEAKVFSKKDTQSSIRRVGITNGTSLTMIRKTSYQEALNGTAVRLEALATLGVPDDVVMAPIINPFLFGGPQWPTRPAWRWFRGDHGLVYASEGLSDPWEPQEDDMEPSGLAGFGLEVFMGSADLPSQCLQSVVAQVSNTVAGAGGTQIHDLIAALGCVSLEVDGNLFPLEVRSPEGRVGVLLGTFGTLGVSDTVMLAGGSVRLVEIALLHPRELATIRVSGEAARNEIYRRLKSASAAAGNLRWISSPERPSVVPPDVDIACTQTATMIAQWPSAATDSYWV